MFEELTQDEVKQIINHSQTKSCELDALPTRVLNSYLNELLPFMTKLVSLSLRQGVFPSKCKQTIVRPPLKKIGLDLSYAN